MKILCSWQRTLVKYELGVALAALKLAKARVFKGYGSWRCRFEIDFAIDCVESALDSINAMAPPPSRKLARMEKMVPTDDRRKG